MSFITNLTSLSQLDGLLAKKDKLVVIDFTAEWCGPCRTVKPVYERLSNEFRHVSFAKCDVDNAKEIAAKYSVRAMPTFIFIKNGSTLETIQGANISALENALKKYGGPAGASSFQGAGRTLGGDVVPPPAAPSSLPDLRLIIGVVVLIGLWYWYGQGGEESNIVIPSGGDGFF